MADFPLYEVYDRPATIVEAQIEAMSARADAAVLTANSAISALSSLDIGGETTTPELYPVSDPNAIIMVPDGVGPSPDSSIDELAIPEFDELDYLGARIDAIVAGIRDAGEFNPSITSIVIPAPPAPINRTAPTRPELLTFTTPEVPTLQIPSMSDFLAINLPSFTMPTLPTFTDMDVNFEGSFPSTTLNYTEPVYSSALLTATRTEILRKMAGGTGMHPAVEAAMFDREKKKNNDLQRKLVQEAYDGCASRGFSLPTGMLLEQVNVANQEALMAANVTLREIYIASAEWEQKNLQQAVESGILLEGKLMDQFENVAKRVFQAAVERLQADMALLGQHIALYNARQAARQTLVEVFKARLQSALAPLEVFKALLEAEQIKGQINESTARAYAAQIDGLKAVVSLFTARVEAVKVQAEIEKNKVELYQADIQAYAALIGADRSRFDAYEAQVRGESAKAGIIEAEARAFAATVEAQNSGSNLKIQAVRGHVDAVGASVAKFSALLGAERDRIQAQATAVTAGAQVFSANVGRYAAELQGNTEQARLAATQIQSRVSNNLAYYQIRVAEYDQVMQRLIERAKVISSANTAAGNMASTLGSGAFSAMHVQASLSGSGNGSVSSATSNSTSTNYNYERE